LIRQRYQYDFKPYTTMEPKNWNDVKKKLQQKYPSLTEADLSYEDGKRDELIERLQSKLGKTKEEITKIISG